jgi:hypothetical protein
VREYSSSLGFSLLPLTWLVCAVHDHRRHSRDAVLQSRGSQGQGPSCQLLVVLLRVIWRLVMCRP